MRILHSADWHLDAPFTGRSPEETERILEGLRPGLEEHHGLSISGEAVHAAVELSCRYLTGYFLPDKALDLLDEGASRARLRRLQQEPEGERWKQLARQLEEKEQLPEVLPDDLQKQYPQFAPSLLNLLRTAEKNLEN